jgi:hypothetical protein
MVGTITNRPSYSEALGGGDLHGEVGLHPRPEGVGFLRLKQGRRPAFLS